MARIRRQNCKDCGTYVDDATFKKTHTSGRCEPCYKIWYKKWCAEYYQKGTLRQRVYYFNRNRCQAKFKEQDLQNIMDAQQRLCKTCGIDLANVKWEIDHILPVSVGGTHDPSNLQILCKRCNRAKDNGSMEDFMQWIDHVAKRIGLNAVRGEQEVP